MPADAGIFAVMISGINIHTYGSESGSDAAAVQAVKNVAEIQKVAH